MSDLETLLGERKRLHRQLNSDVYLRLVDAIVTKKSTEGYYHNLVLSIHQQLEVLEVQIAAHDPQLAFWFERQLPE